MLEIDTPHGPAQAYLHAVDEPRGALVLGHGAGGGVQAPDLVAATKAANEEGFTVALVEQPYRVAGRRSPAPAKQLDAAWIAVVTHLKAKQLANLPIVVGGRSLGARVACRTVDETGAVAVLCLAFPLEPPRCRCSSSRASAIRSGCLRPDQHAGSRRSPATTASRQIRLPSRRPSRSGCLSSRARRFAESDHPGLLARQLLLKSRASPAAAFLYIACTH
jgi:pimeloyl-ACP methyl ester carboxylesterase